MSWEAHPSGEGVRVVTANGIYEAGKIIISAGAWAPDLLRDLGVSLQVERHVQMFFEPTQGIDVFQWENSRFIFGKQMIMYSCMVSLLLD